jgi:hypothetical protein
VYGGLTGMIDTGLIVTCIVSNDMELHMALVSSTQHQNCKRRAQSANKGEKKKQRKKEKTTKN